MKTSGGRRFSITSPAKTSEPKMSEARSDMLEFLKVEFLLVSRWVEDVPECI
jgi:hypothetical protein